MTQCETFFILQYVMENIVFQYKYLGKKRLLVNLQSSVKDGRLWLLRSGDGDSNISVVLSSNWPAEPVNLWVETDTLICDHFLAEL